MHSLLKNVDSKLVPALDIVRLVGKMRAEPKPKVQVRPYSYQPSKAELEEDVSVVATPEEVRAALSVRPRSFRVI